MLLYSTMVLVLLLANHQVLCYCSLAKPDSHAKSNSLASWDYCHGIVFVARMRAKINVVLDPQSLCFNLHPCTSTSAETIRSFLLLRIVPLSIAIHCFIGIWYANSNLYHVSWLQIQQNRSQQLHLHLLETQNEPKLGSYSCSIQGNQLSMT